jgi:ketosteroid isomerase-like protein
MRKILTIFAFVLAFSSQGQNNRPEDVIIDMFDAMAALDLEKMKTYWTKDMILIENREVWNMDTLIHKLEPRKRDRTFQRVNRIEFLDSKVAGDMAYLYYNNQATIRSKGTLIRIKWIENAVLYKENGGWKIHFMHSTMVDRSPRN